MDYTTYLVHHGIKGMKWGIRRYQNPDGSLTEAGKKRYRTYYSDSNGTEAKLTTADRLEIMALKSGTFDYAPQKIYENAVLKNGGYHPDGSLSVVGEDLYYSRSNGITESGKKHLGITSDDPIEIIRQSERAIKEGRVRDMNYEPLAIRAANVATLRNILKNDNSPEKTALLNYLEKEGKNLIYGGEGASAKWNKMLSLQKAYNDLLAKKLSDLGVPDGYTARQIISKYWDSPVSSFLEIERPEEYRYYRDGLSWEDERHH